MPNHKSHKPRRARMSRRKTSAPLSAAEQDALHEDATEHARRAHRLVRAGDLGGAARALNAANRSQRLVAALAAWADRARLREESHALTTMTKDDLYARLETLLGGDPSSPL